MYRKILVPLDGSMFGEHALPLALAIARRTGAEVQFAHVHMPAAPLYAGTELITDLALDTALREHEQSYLDDVAQRATATGGRVLVSTCLLGGTAAEALSARAQATGADLVVLTTHGRGPLSRLWLGSVADQLIRQSATPILLVRPRETPPQFATDSLPRHVLVTLDGSPLAEEIIEPAVALGRLAGADFLLLRVVKKALPANCSAPAETISAYGESLLKQLEDQEAASCREAEAYLESVAGRLRSAGLSVRTRVVCHEQPSTAILEQIGAEGADLVALETHGRHGLARLFLGSIADKVLRGASIPMLVQRARAVAAGQSEPETTGKRRDRSAAVPPPAMTELPKNAEGDSGPGCFHGQGHPTTAEAKWW